MDLLGSILNSMDKPPTANEQQKKMLKKQQEIMQKKQDEERTKLKKFKEDIESRINKFIQSDSEEKLTFEPMNKVQRSIVHEIAEIAGMSAFSFGEEDVDRHIVIFKKEFTPSNEELSAYRRGETWDPEAAKAQQSAAEASAEEESSADDSASKIARKRKEAAVPARYIEKYEHLLGKETAKDAARRTQMNKQYGFVPSANKKDQRSIEQTLADIRAKKKQKLDD